MDEGRFGKDGVIEGMRARGISKWIRAGERRKARIRAGGRRKGASALGQEERGKEQVD